MGPTTVNLPAGSGGGMQRHAAPAAAPLPPRSPDGGSATSAAAYAGCVRRLRGTRPDPPGRPGRRRDRHGRGLRGPLAPDGLPLTRSRQERFDDLVLDAVERIERRLGPRLDGVEFAVEEVPPTEPEALLDPVDPVPLARNEPAGPGRPARVVVYRRPLELRAPTGTERSALVNDVVVEQVADLLGLGPEQVDPAYGED